MYTHNWFKSVLLSLGITAVSIAATAQQKDVLITIGNDKVTKSEFEAVYKKNNPKQTSSPDEKMLREYLDLYINFRVKVKEAESLGLDTASAFKRELAGYRKQLAAPYLTDKEVTEKLIKEAFERSQKEIRASHILIDCKEDASPKDTLAAYNKIMAIRKRIVEKGEDFGKVAAQVSDDQSAKTNKGDLGFFTVFSMVYPFESAAYQAKTGQVTMPVRTRFGYHIIKVSEVRPAQGEVKVAHIMIRLNNKPAAGTDTLKAKAQIDEIYNKLRAGQSFEDLAKQYSEDKNSARNGGVLPAFGTGKMIPEFETESFNLKKTGDYSQPFRTVYGWHIVKLLERKAPQTFDEMKNELKAKVQRDSRSEQNKLSFIRKLKAEYKFTENSKNLSVFYAKNDSAISKGTFAAKDATNAGAEIFQINGKVVTVEDYAKFLEQNQSPAAKADLNVYKKNLYNDFVERQLMDYEESRLDEKYPDFKSLMREYRDGILLFELTDEKVWSAAVKDTTGLKNYFSKNNSNYVWAERLDATVYTTANEAIAAQVRKLMKNKRISEDSLLRRINADNPLNLTIKSEKFEKGESAVIDGIAWKKGITPNMNINNTVVFVKVRERLPAQPKHLNEVRGAATADYQNYLEKAWIDSLRAKYPSQVNEDVFKTLLK